MSVTPTDNGREIPWIDEWARVVVRLHPRPGTADRTESHLGGPMLWPRDEPWPECDGTAHSGLGLDDDQVRGLVTPFAGALQLYRRDFPELPFPDGTDLLQVFLCLLEHEEIWGPDVRLVWRASGQVTDPLAEQPVPVLVEPGFEFEPCVFAPCRGREYPMLDELPHELRGELEFEKAADHRGGGAECWPGLGDSTKIGGWTRWFAGGPGGEECPECGATRVQLLALASQEDACAECDAGVGEHPGWMLAGRPGAMNVFACPRDVRHALKLEAQ